jgi:hypothetical protein
MSEKKPRRVGEHHDNNNAEAADGKLADIPLSQK